MTSSNVIHMQSFFCDVDESNDFSWKSQVFDRLRNSDCFSKLECVHGDLTTEKLSISDRDEMKLRKNVDLVFHLAANVRFDQPLKSALILNTLGTKRVLDLACTFEKLIGFVHVSTTYCHCDLTVLEEKIYGAPHDPRYFFILSIELKFSRNIYSE